MKAGVPKFGTLFLGEIMATYTRFVGIKFKEDEYKIVEQKAKTKNYKSVSEFIRESVLESNGMLSVSMKKQLSDLQWEINKIGTNINQATKRINAGMGTTLDVKDLLANQQRLNILMQDYIDKVEDVWQ